MNFTAETLAIAIAFILPGFLANRLADYYSTSDARQESAFEATLSSLAISAGVLFIQAILASIALAILWIYFRSTFDHFELNKLVDEGLESHFRAQPLLVAATVGGVALVSIIIGFLIGYYDVIRTLLKPRLTDLGLTDENTWYIALKSARQEAGKNTPTWK